MPTTHRSLISAAELQALQATGTACVLLDCSFDLADPAAGERAYAEGHLPGALYVHLDRDLSGAKTGHNGRHPLPERQALAAARRRLGRRARRAGGVLRRAGHALCRARLVAAALAGPRRGGGAGRRHRRLDGRRRQPDARADAAPQPQPPYPRRPPAMPTLQADELLAQLGRRAGARRARRASASAARSSRWTRWPGTSPAR